MMTQDTNNQNSEILNNIIAASAKADMQVAEDIYDQADNKLLAKGYKITPKIRDKVLNRVLRKPLETSIESENSITNVALAQEALSLAKHDALLSTIFDGVEAEALALAKLHIDPLVSMLLTVMRDGASNQLKHALFVTLVARTIARKMQLSEREVTNLSLAGLLHDVGDLYVSVSSDGMFSISDWRKIMSHPVTGSAIVKLYTNYPIEVSTAIFEHHERCDGSGYPKGMNANDCSTIGQILIVSEAVAGMLASRGHMQNTVVALRTSPGIYPKKPLNVLNGLLKSVALTPSKFDRAYVISRLKRKLNTLNSVNVQIDEIIKANEMPPLLADVTKHLKRRVEGVFQIIYASGLYYYVEDNSWDGTEDNAIILLELAVTTSEIKWYIQDILRDLTFRLIPYHSALPEPLAVITEELAKIIESSDQQAEVAA